MGAESTTERNLRRIREASDRLLSGRARLSDGKLTLKSLAVEAGLPRQYLYREAYRDVTAEFEAHSKAVLARAGSPDERLAEIERLRVQLTEARGQAQANRADVRRLREEIRIAANQIAFLTAQNLALREQLHASAAVTQLAARPAGAPPPT